MFQDLASFGSGPFVSGARARNTMLDWFFYDVDGLTPEERITLVGGPNTEGAIIVVWPRGAQGMISLKKYDSHAELRAAPGAMLTHFTIAGVGSSDVGAAAFARTAANVLGVPVGAIVAGYGVADLLSEAMGGWFVMGGANRVMQMYRDAVDQGEGETDAVTRSVETAQSYDDSATLSLLMQDEDREIRWIGGHSKGNGSIALGLRAALAADAGRSVERLTALRITTVSAVTAMPPQFENIGQYLGELDWFGGMNSRRSLDYETVPGAWHHLNTAIPGHLDFAEVLAREPL